MKTKKLFFMLTLMASHLGYAQVNLDQPISVGVSDHVFRSAVDQTIAYYIPIALNRQGPVQITQPDGIHLQARFMAGVATENISFVKSQLTRLGLSGLNVRFFRPVDYTIDPKDATDIGPEFDPILSPLGDLDLAGPMPYSLRVNRFGHRFRTSGGTNLFNRLFGKSGEDNVGIIRYQFSAIQAGKPQLVRSAVGLFVAEPKEIKTGLDRLMNIFSDFSIDHMEPSQGQQFLNDQDSKCWETVQPGQFCLRNEN